MIWQRLVSRKDIRTAERQELPCDLDGWREARDEIRQAVDRSGVDPEHSCFVQAFDSQELDASLLLLPLVGFVRDANDPRMVATVERIERELGSDRLLLRRYRGQLGDGLTGEEGYFLMAPFWLVEVLAMQGRWTRRRRASGASSRSATTFTCSPGPARPPTQIRLGWSRSTTDETSANGPLRCSARDSSSFRIAG